MGSYTSTDGLTLYYNDDPGPDGAVPAVCLPGLTRNSRDFEKLAQHLAAGRRVLSPDLRGRGRSAYDPEPAHYHPGTYVGDVLALLEAADVNRVVVIGTSLGGLLAMMLAAVKPDSIAGVILNDVGPEIDPRGLERIRGYVGKGAACAGWDDAAAVVRELNHAVFPDFEADDWLTFARNTYAEASDGTLVPDYDPRISDAFSEPSGATPAADMWPLYAALRDIPTLAIRGAHSDILSPATFTRMLAEKPDLVQLTVPRRGHAPLLTEPECLAAIDQFLKPL